MGAAAKKPDLLKSSMAFALVLAAGEDEGGAPSSVAPEWIQIFPAPVDGIIRARPGDDRQFRLASADALLAHHASRETALLIDYDHTSEKLDRWTAQTAPAAAWVERGNLEARPDGSVWAKPDYTPKGGQTIAEREYRYISPAFLHDDDGNIVALTSIGLVNNPAFAMQALAAHENNGRPPQENDMKISTEALAKLGLEPDATEDQVNAALAALETSPAAPAPSQDLVPRADLELAHKQRAEAQAALEKAEAESFGRDVDELLAKAVAGKQIAPSSRDYHRATCFHEGKPVASRLEALKEHLKAAPVIAPDLDLAHKPPPGTGSTAAGDLTAAQLATAKACGITPDEYKKSLADIAARRLAATGA